MIRPKGKIERLDFIIAGTQKGGTSALHYHLDQHPNITMAHSEEAHMIDHPRRHFFDDEKRFAAGEVSYGILHEGVRLKRRSLITGSCTPIYTYWKPAMERIRKYHPGIKLIVTASESDRPRLLAVEHEPGPATGDHGISRSHR